MTILSIRRFAQLCFGFISLFYGQNMLIRSITHPEKFDAVIPSYVPAGIIFIYIIAVIMIISGICFIANRLTRVAGPTLGITIILVAIIGQIMPLAYDKELRLNDDPMFITSLYQNLAIGFAAIYMGVRNY